MHLISHIISIIYRLITIIVRRIVIFFRASGKQEKRQHQKK